eukprot:3153649-Rhodomonas_salina.3
MPKKKGQQSSGGKDRKQFLESLKNYKEMFPQLDEVVIKMIMETEDEDDVYDKLQELVRSLCSEAVGHLRSAPPRPVLTCCSILLWQVLEAVEHTPHHEITSQSSRVQHLPKEPTQEFDAESTREIKNLEALINEFVDVEPEIVTGAWEQCGKDVAATRKAIEQMTTEPELSADLTIWTVEG